MIDQNQTSRLLEFLSSSRTLFILFSNTQQVDLLLAVLASYLFLKELPADNKAKLNIKELAVFCPKKLDKELARWPELKSYLKDQKLLTICHQDLGRENLLISFPYQAEQVDKVAYHIGEGDKRFYLTIKPKKGSLPLNHQEVEYSYIGSNADLLVLFGVNDLEDLKDLYFNYQQLYQDTSIITINSFLPDFGTLNLDISGSSGYGEALFYLLKSLANLIDIEMSNLPSIDRLATLLLTSISIKTKEFSSSQMTANSFLAVAELMKLGAKRFDLNSLESFQPKQSQPTIEKKSKQKNKSDFKI